MTLNNMLYVLLFGLVLIVAFYLLCKLLSSLLKACFGVILIVVITFLGVSLFVHDAPKQIVSWLFGQ